MAYEPRALGRQVNHASQLQGRDEITINALVERLWTLISDSKELENWGPPVRGQVRQTLGGRWHPFRDRRFLFHEGSSAGVVERGAGDDHSQVRPPSDL